MFIHCDIDSYELFVSFFCKEKEKQLTVRFGDVSYCNQHIMSDFIL